MKKTSIFKPWVPNWTIQLVLVICMLHTMALLGLYTSNISYAASYFDIEPEDLQFSMSLTYGTFLATILIESRLFKYFPPRNYLITIYLLSAILFVVSAYTNDFVVFAFLRILEGILMALPWIPLRILMLSRTKSPNATIIVFSITYGALLAASPFIVNIAVWLLDTHDWKYMTFGSAIFQIMVASLIWLTFTANRFHRKIPLYKVDWTSFVLLTIAILTGVYVLNYGEKLYWFQSENIVICAITSLVLSALFIIRQMTYRRSCFDMSVFSYRNLRLSLLLFIVFYISRATLTICHTTMSKVWQWEPLRVAHVQYLNLLGVFIGMTIAGTMMVKKLPTKLILILGFLTMAIYHWWFTFLFLPDVALSQMWIPYMLQGVGVGVLFVPLVLNTVSAVPAYLAPFAGAIGVAGRFWGTNIGFCLVQNFQVYFVNKHRYVFLEKLLPENPTTTGIVNTIQESFVQKGYDLAPAATLALKKVNAGVQTQSFLLGNMELFTVWGYGLFLVALYIAFNRHLRFSFNLLKNKYFS